MTGSLSVPVPVLEKIYCISMQLPACDCCQVQLNGRLCLVTRAVLASPLQSRPSGRLKSLFREQSLQTKGRRRTIDSGRRDHIHSQVCALSPLSFLSFNLELGGVMLGA